jgi:hypothetical protein
LTKLIFGKCRKKLKVILSISNLIFSKKEIQ